jgi:ATP:ADP antiporter, AAA family
MVRRLLEERVSDSSVEGKGSALHRLVDVREGEMPSLMIAWAYFFCLLTINYILRPMREQIGVAGGEVALAINFMGTLGGMIVANPLYAWIVTRWPRQKFLPFVYRFFATNLVVFYLLFRFSPESWRPALSFAFFVWVSVINLFAVATFWSLMADLFSFEQGKRLFGFISVGGTLGAITGSAFVSQVAKSTDPGILLLVAVALFESTVWAMRALVRKRGLRAEELALAREAANDRPEDEETGGILNGMSLVFRSSYLTWICLYMLVGSIAGTILYFLQADIVKAAASDKGAQTAIFAKIDLGVNVLTLIVQLFLTGRMVKRLGVGVTLCLQCAAFGIALVALGFDPSLNVLCLAMVFFRTGHYATSRPAREVLFTVVGREAKYKSKSFIDTFVYRGGDAIGAWLKYGMGSLGGLGLQGIALASIPIALIWGTIAIVVGRKQRALLHRRAEDEALSRSQAIR